MMIDKPRERNRLQCYNDEGDSEASSPYFKQNRQNKDSEDSEASEEIDRKVRAQRRVEARRRALDGQISAQEKVPVLDSDDVPNSDSANDLAIVSYDQEGSRVLVVDDTISNLLSVGAVFEQMEFPFSMAQSGPTAINIIKTRMQKRLPLFDLIFMDFQMPGLSGPDTTKEIRKLLNQEVPRAQDQPD